MEDRKVSLTVWLGGGSVLCGLAGVALAQYQRYRAEALTAQALLTANETAQTATRAASLSSVLLLVVLILLLLLLLAGVLALFVGYVRRQRRQQRSAQRSWLSGPNARWGEARSSAPDTNALPELSDTLNMLIQVQLLQALERLLPAASTSLALRQQEPEDDLWWPS
jgi:hypothetical protein